MYFVRGKMKIKKFTGLVFLLICILSFSACDGSVRGSRPQSLSVGNDWNSMKALGAVSFSGTGRARSISSGGALDDSAVFIAVKDDGTIEDMVLLDENGNNVLENKIVSYYKQRSRFDFINVQSSDNPNYWPFDDWVHSPDDDDSFTDTLIQLQGDTNCGKIMEVTLENDEEKPEVVSLNSQNYDKEFTVTDSSVVERIYSAYGQEPWYCIRVGKVGFSGDILEDAFEYYNSIVSKQQRLIERTFDRIFRYWYEVANPSNDFSVQPLKYVRNAEVSDNNA